MGRPRKNPIPEGSTGAGAHAKPFPTIAPKKPATPPPTLKAPDFTEWADFLGTVVFRWAARAIAAFILRGIDRDIITPEDKEDIDLDDEQLAALGKPFAHMAVRSQFMTKHGRAIIDSKDGIEAAVIMFMWMGRVNRVARKYRPRHAHKRERTESESVGSGETIPEGPAPGFVTATANGHGFN